MSKAAPRNFADSFEKIPVHVFPNQKDGSVYVARLIADFIKEKQKKKKSVYWDWPPVPRLKHYMRNW